MLDLPHKQIGAMGVETGSYTPGLTLDLEVNTQVNYPPNCPPVADKTCSLIIETGESVMVCRGGERSQ